MQLEGLLNPNGKAVNRKSPVHGVNRIAKKLPAAAPPPKPKAKEPPDLPTRKKRLQRRALAHALCQGHIPPLLLSLPIEVFDYEEGALWEELFKFGDGSHGEITVKALRQEGNLLTMSSWSEEKLERLKKAYKPCAEPQRPPPRAGPAARLRAREGDRQDHRDQGRYGPGRRRRLPDQRVAEARGPGAQFLALGPTISTEDMFALDCSVNFLIEDVLVEAQPMVMGALSKSMKTSVMLDMAISLGSGTKFLDKFACVKTPVLVFTGESGKAVIQATAKSIAKARELEAKDIDAHWSFQVPLISEDRQVQVLRAEILQHHARVLCIDPTYLALADKSMSEHGGSVFNFGRLIKGISEMCQELGVALVLLHHYRKTGEVDKLDPCSLERLAQAGFAEWARQWFLMERREKYQHDGIHKMWMKTGGSAGHGNLWHLTINEGKPKGSKWETTVVTNAAHEQAIAEQKQDAAEVAEHQKLLQQASQVQLALADGEKPLSMIAADIGRSYDATLLILKSLVIYGSVKMAGKKKAKNGKLVNFYKWIGGSESVEEAPSPNEFND